MNPATHDSAQLDLIGFTATEAEHAAFLAREDVQKRLRSKKRWPDRMSLTVNGVRWRAVRGNWSLEVTRHRGYPVVWWHIFMVDAPERGFFTDVSSAACGDWLRQWFRTAIQVKAQYWELQDAEKEKQA